MAKVRPIKKDTRDDWGRIRNESEKEREEKGKVIPRLLEEIRGRRKGSISPVPIEQNTESIMRAMNEYLNYRPPQKFYLWKKKDWETLAENVIRFFQMREDQILAALLDSLEQDLDKASTRTKIGLLKILKDARREDNRLGVSFGINVDHSRGQTQIVFTEPSLKRGG